MPIMIPRQARHSLAGTIQPSRSPRAIRCPRRIPASRRKSVHCRVIKRHYIPQSLHERRRLNRWAYQRGLGVICYRKFRLSGPVKSTSGYDAPHLLKVAVIMTDGGTTACIAMARSVRIQHCSGSQRSRQLQRPELIPTQAQAYAAMKAAGVIVHGWLSGCGHFSRECPHKQLRDGCFACLLAALEQSEGRVPR